MKANTLVREANIFADEMGKQTTFGVTLQIPPQNLSPNRKRSAFVSEPAILVKRKGKPNQVGYLCSFEILFLIVNDNDICCLVICNIGVTGRYHPLWGSVSLPSSQPNP